MNVKQAILLFVYAVPLCINLVQAQDCLQSPADCPDNETLQQLKDTKWQGDADKCYINPNADDYLAIFAKDKKIMTPKMCNKVQSVSAHIEGSVDNINQFIQSINWQQINQLIVNQ